MKIVDCTQGSPEWFSARLGLPTASCFDQILTPTGKPSTQAAGYAHLLLAEQISGQPQGWEGNRWTERGTELEPQAREYYSFVNDVEVEQVGFCLRDDGRVGCSPDGLVDADGLLEIKCPSPQVHLGYLLDGIAPTKYFSQIHGQLYVTGRSWCDFLSYHPDLPPLVVRVEADQKYQIALHAALEAFLELLRAKRAQLEKWLR